MLATNWQVIQWGRSRLAPKIRQIKNWVEPSQVDRMQDVQHADLTLHRVDVGVGRNIRRLRKATGKSKAQFGLDLSISELEVHRLEIGVDRTSSMLLFAIAEAYQVPIWHFYRNV